jgi:hypothetical protein
LERAILYVVSYWKTKKKNCHDGHFSKKLYFYNVREYTGVVFWDFIVGCFFVSTIMPSLMLTVMIVWSGPAFNYKFLQNLLTLILPSHLQRRPLIPQVRNYSPKIHHNPVDINNVSVEVTHPIFFPPSSLPLCLG